jgi:hypothetical protein
MEVVWINAKERLGKQFDPWENANCRVVKSLGFEVEASPEPLSSALVPLAGQNIQMLVVHVLQVRQRWSATQPVQLGGGVFLIG